MEISDHKACDFHINSLLQMLSLRDVETEEHTRRVTGLFLQFAELWDIPVDELVHMQRGAQLHDIGKIGVPDAILRKREPLTADERTVIRTHPTQAYRLLYPVSYLRPALDIPCYHHEKWDGTGYPEGRKHEQIPFSARLFAVVDVWDALLSNRPYRPAWSRDAGLDYIRCQSGKHFDPQVAAAFERMLDGRCSDAHAGSALPLPDSLITAVHPTPI